MSRSYRKTPIYGNVGDSSEKYDKRRCNKKMRRVNKERLYKGEEIFIIEEESLDNAVMNKDGKHYVSEKYRNYKIMRK